MHYDTLRNKLTADTGTIMVPFFNWIGIPIPLKKLREDAQGFAKGNVSEADANPAPSLASDT